MSIYQVTNSNRVTSDQPATRTGQLPADKQRFSKLCLGLALACGAVIVGCQSRAPAGASGKASGDAPTIVRDATLSEDEKALLLSAKEALVTKLTGRLMDAMAASGPAGAIEVCQLEAKQIALDVGQAQNVSIGRTGVRLRNTNNLAPAWAEQLVADKVDSPVFVRLSNQRAAALLPIKLQAQCLMCHGPSEAIAPDVKTKLASLYPNDQATGFAEGELRGWFWVESVTP